MLLLILGSTLLAVSAYLVGERITQPERDRRALVRRAARYGAPRAAAASIRDRQSLSERVLVPASARVAGWMLRLNPRENLEQVHQRLLAAGMPTVSPSGFLAAKGMLASVGVLFGLL